jgi:hypothetical protein
VDDETLRSARALTIDEFCFVEHISKASFYAMQRQGTGPEVTYLPARGRAPMPRVSAQARRDWHAALKARHATAAAALEATRKREQCAEAGKLAAESVQHVSKRQSTKPRRRRSK